MRSCVIRSISARAAAIRSAIARGSNLELTEEADGAARGEGTAFIAESLGVEEKREEIESLAAEVDTSQVETYLLGDLGEARTRRTVSRDLRWLNVPERSSADPRFRIGRGPPVKRMKLYSHTKSKRW